MIGALSTPLIIGGCVLIVAVFFAITHAQPNRNYGRDPRKSGLS